MLQIHEIRPAFISRSRRHCTATVWSRASKTLAKCVVIRLHTELLTSQDVYTIRFADIALKKKKYQKQKCNFFIHFSKLIALLRLVPSSYIQSSFCFLFFCCCFLFVFLPYLTSWFAGTTSTEQLPRWHTAVPKAPDFHFIWVYWSV